MPLGIRIIKSKELSCLYAAGLYSMRVGMTDWVRPLNVKKIPEKPVEYSEVWQENHCLLGTPAFQFYVINRETTVKLHSRSSLLQIWTQTRLNLRTLI